MNIVWILLMIVLAVWEGARQPNQRNLISVLVDRNHHMWTQSTVKHQYSSQALRKLGEILHDQPCLWRLDHDTIRTIKLLKINRRRIRFQRPRSGTSHVRNINPHNLVSFPVGYFSVFNTMQKRLNLMTLNVRSLKGKINLVEEQIVPNATDIICITETWLKNNEEDTVWLKSTFLSKEPY